MENLVIGLGPSSFWTSRRVFITGANGFLGSHLARALVHAGARVFAFLRNNSDRTRLQDIAGRITYCGGDILDPKSLLLAIRSARPDLVYHCAATGLGPADPQPTIVSVNAVGAYHLAWACAEAQISRLVYVGTCLEYGAGRKLHEGHALCPTTLYGAAKAAGALLTQALAIERNLPLVMVRPFTVYGPWDRHSHLIPHVILAALSGADLRLSGGDQERDFIYVDDVISGLLLAGEKQEAAHKSFNLSSSSGRSIRSIVDMILSMTRSSSRVDYGSVPYRPGEVFEQCGSFEAATRWLGWRPTTSLEEGLRRSIAWYQERLNSLHPLETA